LLSFAFFYLRLFFRIETLQGLTADSNKKIPAPRSGCIQHLEIVSLLPGQAAERVRSTGLSSLMIIGPVSALCKKMSHNSGILAPLTSGSSSSGAAAAVTARKDRARLNSRLASAGRSRLLQLIARPLEPLELRQRDRAAITLALKLARRMIDIGLHQLVDA
jgi:hypothetical protein